MAGKLKLKIHSVKEQVDEYENKELAEMWEDVLGAKSWEGLIHQRMNSVMKKELLKYGRMAALCYNAFDAGLYYGENEYGGCKYPPQELFEKSMGGLFATSKSRYEVRGYIYAETDPLILGRFHQSVWIGFVAVCVDEQVIKRMGRRDVVVAWRGTQTPQEWLKDVSDLLVHTNVLSNKMSKVDDDVFVEVGFLNTYCSVGQDTKSAKQCVRDEVMKAVKEFGGENLSITFVGHSLGAALATLSAYDIKMMLNDENKNKTRVCVFAFACPRVGNLGFAKKIEEMGVKVLRVVNKRDLVPKVPGLVFNEKTLPCCVARLLQWLPWAYFHCGVEMKVDSHGLGMKQVMTSWFHPIGNLAYSHSMDVYLRLVEGYTGTSHALHSLSEFHLHNTA